MPALSQAKTSFSKPVPRWMSVFGQTVYQQRWLQAWQQRHFETRATMWILFVAWFICWILMLHAQKITKYSQRCWITCFRHSKLVAQNSVPSRVLGQQKTDRVDYIHGQVSKCVPRAVRKYVTCLKHIIKMCRYDILTIMNILCICTYTYIYSIIQYTYTVCIYLRICILYAYTYVLICIHMHYTLIQYIITLYYAETPSKSIQIPYCNILCLTMWPQWNLVLAFCRSTGLVLPRWLWPDTSTAPWHFSTTLLHIGRRHYIHPRRPPSRNSRGKMSTWIGKQCLCFNDLMLFLHTSSSFYLHVGLKGSYSCCPHHHCMSRCSNSWHHHAECFERT